MLGAILVTLKLHWNPNYPRDWPRAAATAVAAGAGDPRKNVKSEALFLHVSQDNRDRGSSRDRGNRRDPIQGNSREAGARVQRWMAGLVRIEFVRRSPSHGTDSSAPRALFATREPFPFHDSKPLLYRCQLCSLSACAAVAPPLLRRRGAVWRLIRASYRLETRRNWYAMPDARLSLSLSLLSSQWTTSIGGTTFRILRVARSTDLAEWFMGRTTDRWYPSLESVTIDFLPRARERDTCIYVCVCVCFPLLDRSLLARRRCLFIERWNRQIGQNDQFRYPTVISRCSDFSRTVTASDFSETFT